MTISLRSEQERKQYYHRLATLLDKSELTNNDLSNLPPSELREALHEIISSPDGLLRDDLGSPFPRYNFYESKGSYLRRYLASRMITRETVYLARHPGYHLLSPKDVPAPSSLSFISSERGDYSSSQQIRDLISTMTDPAAHGRLTPSERLRLHLGRWLTSLRDHGNAAYVYPVLYDERIPLLLKTGDEETFETGENGMLPHQYFVGMIMNELRLHIPTFMYTYGLARNPPPLRSPSSGRSIAFVNNHSLSSDYMLFLEQVPGITLDRYLRDHHYASDPRVAIRQITTLLLQIIYGLEVAQHQYRFVHKDLHPDNVLVVPSSSRIITYPTRPALSITDLAVIIDYGDSSIEVDGITYGTYNLEAGITPAFHPYQDVFRLLAGIMYLIQYRLPSDDPIVHPLRTMLAAGISFLIPPEGNQSEVEWATTVITTMMNNDSYFILLTPVTEENAFSSFVDYLTMRWGIPDSEPHDLRWAYYRSEDDHLAEIVQWADYPSLLHDLITTLRHHLADRDRDFASLTHYEYSISSFPEILDRYIIILSTSNIIDTDLRCLSWYDPSEFRLLEEENRRRYTAIVTYPPLLLIIRLIELDHLVNVDYEDPDDSVLVTAILEKIRALELAPFSTASTEELIEEVTDHMPAWIRDNYYKLLEILPRE